MRPLTIIALAIVSVSCQSAAQDRAAQDRTAQDRTAQDRSQAASPDVVAMERAALDRWGKGDPQGYLEIMANEVTYFDPMQEKRMDGLEAMRKMLAPITGKVKVSRFDMIGPKVQHHGDAALLTFNLVSYVAQPDGKERAVARWNSSELGFIDDWEDAFNHQSMRQSYLVNRQLLRLGQREAALKIRMSPLEFVSCSAHPPRPIVPDTALLPREPEAVIGTSA